MSTNRLTHLTKQALSNAVLCSALGLLLLSGQSHAATPLENRAASYEAALSLYRKHQWSRAFRELSRFAETGHQESARIALFMLQHGSQLYATAWSSHPAQITRWIQVSKTSMAMFEADGAD